MVNQIIKIFTTCHLLLTTCIYAQNLVPNPSFEDTLHCPVNANQLNDCQLWINPAYGTPDYLNACAGNGNAVNVPHNWYGTQSAHSGVAYAGIYIYNTFPKNGGREYVQAKLIDSLVAGGKYLVSFYVSLADTLEYSANTIGAYFSKTAISSPNSIYLPYIPQIQNPSNNPLTDKINWMKISDTLIAQGGEKYITIGNFRPDSLSDTLYLGQVTGGWKDSYYYLDDISVIDVATMGIKQETNSNNRLSVYPNPAKDILTISCNTDIEELTIIDVLGNTVIQQKAQSKITSIDISSLNDGVYFIQVNSADKVYTNKFIISR